MLRENTVQVGVCAVVIAMSSAGETEAVESSQGVF